MNEQKAFRVPQRLEMCLAFGKKKGNSLREIFLSVWKKGLLLCFYRAFMMLFGCDSEFFKPFACAQSIPVLIQACAVLPKVLTYYSG